MRRDSARPYRIGLTGGIASGKSVVAGMFADLGIPIIDTDLIAREIVEPGQPALEEIRERFGEHMIDAAGNLDRVAMRKEIFANESARSDLEAILHPRIGAETRRRADAADGDYQLIVVPLLTESGYWSSSIGYWLSTVTKTFRSSGCVLVISKRLNRRGESSKRKQAAKNGSPLPMTSS
jgi:dephospho-CoA kinase